MPIYEYKGFDESGGTKTGIVDADSPREARARLREQAVHVTELEISAVSAHAEGDAGEAKPRRKLRQIFKFEGRIKGASSLPVWRSPFGRSSRTTW